MHKYASISVRIPGDILNGFLDKLSQFAVGKWNRDTAVEQESNALVASMGVRYVHYVRSAPPHRELVFLYQAGELKTINALGDRATLSKEDHSRIVESVWKSGFKMACEEFGLQGIYTRARSVRPEADLPLKVQEALNYFAMAVNKSAGASHPDDMAHWASALILLHVSGATLDEYAMETFLEERKFPSEVIPSLLRDHEMAMVMLDLYDQYRALAKPAVVN